jgi:hypothetical protein
MRASAEKPAARALVHAGLLPDAVAAQRLIATLEADVWAKSA